METRLIDLKNYKNIPKFLAIEGPIGVGKTTLTKKLANFFGYEMILEGIFSESFLGRFL